MSHRHPPLPWFLLVSVALLALVLSACSSATSGTASPRPKASATVSGTPGTGLSLLGTAAPVLSSQPPYSLRVEGGQQVLGQQEVLPAQCLKSSKELKLTSVSLPLGGIQPGSDYQFCAIGVPAGTAVGFELTGPDGGKRTYTVASVDHDGVGVAPLTLRLLPDDKPGDWTMVAAAGDAKSDLRFRSREGKGPMIALSEPLVDNPSKVKAAVGGLSPNGTARFALYSVKEAGQGAAPGALDGAFLISIGIGADAGGRADLELDVADLPAGLYLLVLLPTGAEAQVYSAGDPAILRLPDQEPLVVLANITRPQASGATAAAGETAQGTGVTAGGTPAASPTSGVPQASPLPGAPTAAQAASGLPDALQVNVTPASLPLCTPSSSPILQLTPDRGEVGNWWLGCAQGFAPGEQINVTVAMANGQQTPMVLTASSDGTKDFRWYSAPGEGSGKYKATAKSADGKEASISWNIATATAPHVLVYPHQVDTNVGSDLNLTGFPQRSQVDLGLYRLNEQGQGTLVKKWQVAANKFGAAKVAFDQAFGLEPGQYAVIAQGGPTYNFPGIDVAASAVDFFGYNQALDGRYEVYSLYLGRTEAVAAVTPAAPTVAAPEVAPGAVAEPGAAATPVTGAPIEATAETPVATPTEPPAPTAAAPVAGQIPPATVSLPEDTSGRPTCPGATGGASAICLLPTIVPRGTFAYLLAHGLTANSGFTAIVTTPKGERISISDTTDAEGFVDLHWYALNTEPLGTYQVSASGGGQTFTGSFEVVKPTSPHVVVEPRTTPAGTPVKVSVAGFEPNETLILARYRSAGLSALSPANGNVDFTMVDSTELKTGSGGGAQMQVQTTGATDGELYLLEVYRPGQAEPAAQAVYAIGQPLYLRYPFAWAQNFQEGQ